MAPFYRVAELASAGAWIIAPLQLAICILLAVAFLLAERFFKRPGFVFAALGFVLNAVQLMTEQLTGWLSHGLPRAQMATPSEAVVALALDLLASLCFFMAGTAMEAPVPWPQAPADRWRSYLDGPRLLLAVVLVSLYSLMVVATGVLGHPKAWMRILGLAPNVVTSTAALYLLSRFIRSTPTGTGRQAVIRASNALLLYCAIQPLYLLRAVAPAAAGPSPDPLVAASLALYYLGYLIAFSAKSFALLQFGKALVQNIFDSAARAEEFERLKSVRVLVEGIAHTFRQPIGIIAPLVDDLEALVRTDEGRAKMAIVRGQIRRMDELVERILTLRRGVQKEKQLVSVQALARAAEERLKLRRQDDLPVDARIGVDIHVDSTTMVPVIPTLLEPALDAVLDNAVDVVKSQSRGRNIRIAVKENREENKVYVEISNSGPDISDEEASLIFDLFYTTKDEGTGLGLYFAREYIAMQGGRLEYVQVGRSQSKCFRFTLSESTHAHQARGAKA